MAAVAQCCAAGSPPIFEYDSKGKIETIGDLPIYFSGAPQEKAIIVCMDIFGLDIPTTRKNCDFLASQGFYVAAPDYFRGKPWDTTHFPPKDFSELKQWALKHMEHTNADLDITINHLHTQGVKSIGIMGYCFGGKVAIIYAATGTVNAVAVCHGSFMEDSDAEKLSVPAALFPAGNDPDDTKMREILKAKPFGELCVFKRYDTMVHGFCCARGEKALEKETLECAQDVLDLLTAFFRSTLK